MLMKKILNFLLNVKHTVIDDVKSFFEVYRNEKRIKCYRINEKTEVNVKFGKREKPVK